MRTADNSSETGCKREEGPEHRHSEQARSFCTADYTNSRSGLPAAPQQHPCTPPHLRKRREVDALREALAQAGGAKHCLLQLRQRLHALLAGLARELVLGGLQLLRQAEGCAACFQAAGSTVRREGTTALRPCRRSKLHGLTPPMPWMRRTGRARPARAGPERVVTHLAQDQARDSGGSVAHVVLMIVWGIGQGAGEACGRGGGLGLGVGAQTFCNGTASLPRAFAPRRRAQQLLETAQWHVDCRGARGKAAGAGLGVECA